MPTLGTTITPVVFDNALFSLVKAFFIIGFILYVIFAFIATRQIQVMRKTVETPLSGFITLIGYAHLLLAILAMVVVLLLV